MSTTTDKELLELAAKAAGIPIHVWGAKGKELVADMSDPSNHKLWNPLRDDGDALRLAVKLSIDVDEAVYKYCELNLCDHPDRYDATRRAIVRAAAEKGLAA